MLAMLAESTRPDLRRFLFLFVVFDVRIWLLFALALTTLPVPVTLNLLAAPLFDFNLGIFKPPLIN